MPCTHLRASRGVRANKLHKANYAGGQKCDLRLLRAAALQLQSQWCVIFVGPDISGPCNTFAAHPKPAKPGARLSKPRH